MSINFSVASDGEQGKDTLAAAVARKPFLQELEKAKSLADRDANGFAICLIDIDQLRSVNDRHGESGGDCVLQGVSRQALNVLGQPRWQAFRYLLARFDGDSFILLLHGCRLKYGEQLAEELRRECAAAKFGAELSVTVSIAVTAYRSGESIDALLARTEKTLHLAKQFGCDRVETAWTPESLRVGAAETAVQGSSSTPAQPTVASLSRHR